MTPKALWGLSVFWLALCYGSESGYTYTCNLIILCLGLHYVDGGHSFLI